MTAEIVNLRKARKRRAKAAEQAEADANRAKFGRSKRDREYVARTDAHAAKQLDGHRLDRAGGDPGGPETSRAEDDTS